MSHTLLKSGIIRKNVFDFYGSTVIVNKYANAHICSEEYMLTDKIDTTISNGVENIDEKYLIIKDIGTFSWSCTDDKGQHHKKKLNNVLYFPD